MEFRPLQKTIVPLLRKSLEAYSMRHTAVAENIVNVETKHFRPLQVQFEEELRRAVDQRRPVGKKTSDRHMDVGGAKIENLEPRVQELDAMVDVEREMAMLAQNQIKFDFVARKLRGSYEIIKASIRGRNA